MSRTKRFFYNSLTTAFYQVLLMITGFITPLVMLRFYGSEVNGLISSINQFIIYFNLVEAGLSSAAIYALYKPLANRDHQEINSIVTATKKFYIQAGYIFVSLTIGLAVLYPLFLETKVISSFNIGLLVLILGINGALEFFTLAKYRVLLSADQRTYVVSLASMVHIIVNTIIIVVLANLKVDIVVLRLVALFSIFLRSFILMVYVKAKYKFINFREKPNFESLSHRWDALYLQVLGAIQVGAPIVILTIVTKDLLIVSVFTVFSIVTGGLRGILGIFKSGLSSSFGDIIAKREQKVLQKSYKEFEYLYYSVIMIVYFTAFLTIMPFIKIYTSGVNDTNYYLPLVGFLFVLDGFLYSIKNPQGMLVMSAGLFKETKVQATIQGSILIIAGFILTYYFGILGVLIASILSNLYRDIDLIFFVPKNITNLPVKDSVYRIVRICSNMLIMSMPLLFIELNPTGYISWFATALLVGIYALLGTIIMGYLFDKSELLGSFNRMKRMIR
ncbi:hypothetical protein [Mesobacillus subterraneus]|uniref:hypothetical protein n=1 Tax=Mesobacillus subterraneus TaxID=285983 RepID=UPI001CFDE1D1|nr:hypothetical protein [Mesobacillus subterraneus]